MKLPAYGRRLAEQRAKGKRPWLVVVVIGTFDEAKHARAQLGKLEAGAHWLVALDDLDARGSDWSSIVGCDVLVVPYGDLGRYEAMVSAIWRARPATLWRWHDGALLRVGYIAGLREPMIVHLGDPVPLERLRVQSWREQAELLGDAPLFEDEKFFAARADLGRRMGLSDDTVRLLTLGQPLPKAA